MVSVPQQGPVPVRAAAIQRRITACRASAEILRRSKREIAATCLLHEVAELEADLAGLSVSSRTV